MKTYEETMKICEEFYPNCIKFWEQQRHSFPESMALTDISRLQHDPYSPTGAKLDRKAVIDFCESRAYNF